MVQVLRCAFLFITMVSLFATSARAAMVTFDVQAVSSLTLSGGITVPAIASFSNQGGAASLTTTYLGTITVDVDNLLAPTSLTFLSANIDANPNTLGNLSPGASGLGPALPADYGITAPTVAGFGAIRNLVFNVAAGATSVTANNFSVAGQTWSYVNGSSFDVAYPGDQGRADLTIGPGALPGTTAPATALNTGSNGSYTVSGTTATLVIPTNISLAFADGLLGTNTYVGSIRAVATVPEPSTFTLLGVCGACGLAFRRRR